MTDTNEVRRYADAIMTLIKEDQDAGQVPRDVCSWDELDDSVDTEDYYRQAQLTRILVPVAWKTASNDAVKFDPRSRIRNLVSSNRWPRRRARLRACCRCGCCHCPAPLGRVSQ